MAFLGGEWKQDTGALNACLARRCYWQGQIGEQTSQADARSGHPLPRDSGTPLLCQCILMGEEGCTKERMAHVLTSLATLRFQQRTESRGKLLGEVNDDD
jgi:hypothetical protein